MRKSKRKKIPSDLKSVYNVISHIYKELRHNQHIYFRKLKDCQGECDVQNDEITLDYRKELLPTLIHEFIHKFHPTKNEKWVMKREKFIMRRVSPGQAKRLLTLLSYIV